MRKESAVSDIIGAVLLIGIVTASIGIIGVMVTRDIVPTNLPHLDFEACVHGGTVFLYHTGGDTLKPKESDSDFDINLLDENDQTIKTIQHITWTNDEWSAGQVVNISTELHPTLDPSIKKVQLVAKPPGGGETLIEWAQVGECSSNMGPGCLARAFADFSANPESGPISTPVNFTDKSQTDDPAYNITSWEWNFGDGTVSTLRNATHLYATPGIYTVRLRAHNACGSDEVSHPVMPGSQLCPSTVTAGFTTNPSPPVTLNSPTLTVTFTDKSTSSGSTISSLQWDFGDGTTATGNEVTHTFSYGIYWVRLTATDACGHWDTAAQQVTIASDNDCSISPRIKADPKIVTSSKNVTLTDESESSRGTINSWYWEFGDGTTSREQGPHNKTYVNPGPDSRTVRVNLTVNNTCGATGTTYEDITVLPPCDFPVAKFLYNITDYLDFTVQFTDTSEYEPFNLKSWYWEFGDNTTSPEINPLHQYGGLPSNYTVNLTVTNECGLSNKTQRILNPNCEKISANAYVQPLSGSSPLTVFFNDTSTPFNNISSWLWIFGDGISYSAPNASARNTSHTYNKTGTYYATLLVENKCGQAFTYSPIVTVSSKGNISGYLWQDLNLNQEKDSNEPYLNGWHVYLEQRVGNTWIPYDDNITIDGSYTFNFTVSSAVFRVRETLPTSPVWKVTSSYNTEAQNVSGSLPVYDRREYSNVSFGNVDWHKSIIQLPARLEYGSYYPGTKLPYPHDWQLNYTTSADSTERWSYPVDDTGDGTFVPSVSYEAWGNSSFVLYMGFYNLYFKQGSSAWYWLDTWYKNGVSWFKGYYPTIPDNTVITYGNLRLFYLKNSTDFFEFYNPREDQLIPYSKYSYAEVHYVGKSEPQTNGHKKCQLVLPDNSRVALTYDNYLGYNTGFWNNTKWEGTRIRLKADYDLDTPTPNATTYRNVTIDWEPLVVTITKVTSDTSYSSPNYYIKGLTNITANVTGKWRSDNVSLILNNGTPLLMTRTNDYPVTLNRTFNYTLNAEDFAGKNVTFYVNASPQAGHGKAVTSVNKYFNALSKKKLVADFEADPWTGNATLEVFFKDNSTGGPNKWSWDFKDGNVSTLQNSFNYYSNPNNYSVTLNVWNATDGPVNVSKWVNVTGRMHEVSLYATRSGSLLAGGTQKWMTFDTNSTIQVNNTTYTIEPKVNIQTTLPQTISAARILIAGGSYTVYSVSNTSLSINGTFQDTGSCTFMDSPNFLNYHSNMTLNVPSLKWSLVDFFWDGTRIPVDWRQKVTLYDLMPKNRTDMDLDLTSDHVFFTGMASKYSL